MARSAEQGPHRNTDSFVAGFQTRTNVCGEPPHAWHVPWPLGAGGSFRCPSRTCAHGRSGRSGSCSSAGILGLLGEQSPGRALELVDHLALALDDREDVVDLLAPVLEPLGD